MKPLLISLFLIASLTPGFAAQPSSANRKIGDMNVIPTRVLQRSISPRFYKSLLVSPVEENVRVNGYEHTACRGRPCR
jgi:hypothetical protein